MVSRVQPGSIVLFHNAALHTPEALPTILETLLQEGYTFVPISQLLLPGPTTPTTPLTTPAGNWRREGRGLQKAENPV